MSRSYDIFLSHSGAQKEFVQQLFTELSQYGHYSVFFDRDSIKHGEQIDSIILKYATTCKLIVAVLSEEYFTRSRPPMMELAASYTAAKDGSGVPCLLPIFFALKPEHVKNSKCQEDWLGKWEKWKLNDFMGESGVARPYMVQPKVWIEALNTLLGTRGPIYKPHENEGEPAMFSKKVARVIAEKLDDLSKTMIPKVAKVEQRMQKYEEISFDYEGMEHLGKDLNRVNLVSANTSRRVQMEKGKEDHVKPRMKAVGFEFGFQYAGTSQSLPESDVFQEWWCTSGRDIVPQLRSECSLYKSRITVLEDQLKEVNDKSSSRIEELQSHLKLQHMSDAAKEREIITAEMKAMRERERNVTERERNVTERERHVTERERSVTEREENATEREKTYRQLADKIEKLQKQLGAERRSARSEFQGEATPLWKLPPNLATLARMPRFNEK